MDHTLTTQLQPLVAQHLDRRSLYRFSSCHRTLHVILADARCYYFNTPYRPHHLDQLINDLDSIKQPNNSNKRINAAFPRHLTSHTARKSYLTHVHYVDLRYCRENLELAPQVVELLTLTRNVTDLALTGQWSNGLVRYEAHKAMTFPDLRQALLKLPLRRVCIWGPVWERVADVVSDIRTLREFDFVPTEPNYESFHSFPSLTSAVYLTDQALMSGDHHSADWFPSLRTLHLYETGFSDELFIRLQALNLTSLHLQSNELLRVEAVEVLQRLRLKSLTLTLWVRSDDASRTNLGMLLAAPTSLSQSLVTLEVARLSIDFDVFVYAQRFASLTSLTVEYDHGVPATRDVVQHLQFDQQEAHDQDWCLNYESVMLFID